MDNNLRPKDTKLAIMRYLKNNSDVSRIDISEEINLTKAAVSSVINKMLEEGIIEEKGELLLNSKSRTRGRRKVIIKINENYRLALGCTLLNNKLYMGICNLAGGVLTHAEKELPENCTHHNMLQELVELSQKLMAENYIAEDRICSFGIALDSSAPLGCGRESRIKVKKDISHAIDIPVATVTTAQGAICAQCIFGEFTSDKSMLMFCHGEKLSAAALINGEIFGGESDNICGLSDFNIPFSELSDNAALGLDEQVNFAFAERIANAMAVFDIENVFAAGGYFETDFGLTHINMLLSSKYHLHGKVKNAEVNSSKLFAAGAAAGIESSLFGGEII